MKRVLLLIVIVCDCSISFSQSLKDAAIYNLVLARTQSFKNVSVFNYSSINEFKNIDFKHPERYNWNVVDSAGSWKPFFRSVTITEITEKELKAPIDGHVFTKSRFIYDEYKAPVEVLHLSPVIYSEDKTWALCTVSYWGGPENGSGTLYVMHCINGKWIIARIAGLWIS